MMYADRTYEMKKLEQWLSGFTKPIYSPSRPTHQFYPDLSAHRQFLHFDPVYAAFSDLTSLMLKYSISHVCLSE